MCIRDRWYSKTISKFLQDRFMIFILVRCHVTFKVRLLQGFDRQSRMRLILTLIIINCNAIYRCNIIIVRNTQFTLTPANSHNQWLEMHGPVWYYFFHMSQSVYAEMLCFVIFQRLCLGFCLPGVTVERRQIDWTEWHHTFWQLR